MINCFGVIGRNLNFICSYRIGIQQNDSVPFRPAQYQMVEQVVHNHRSTASDRLRRRDSLESFAGLGP